MSIKSREFDHLISKLGFKVRESGDKFVWFEYEGRRRVWTKRSHGKGDLPRSDLIRQQLKLNEDQFRKGLNCKLTTEEYIEILREKGIIPPKKPM